MLRGRLSSRLLRLQQIACAHAALILVGELGRAGGPPVCASGSCSTIAARRSSLRLLLAQGGLPHTQPLLAESVDEIIDMWRLPARIRPAAFAFGTLADGFLAFDAPPAGGSAGSAGGSAAGAAGGASADGEADVGRVSIQLASVVMKAVQNRHAHRGLACSTESGARPVGASPCAWAGLAFPNCGACPALPAQLPACPHELLSICAAAPLAYALCLR